MPVQHVKGQPAVPTYVLEKGCLKKDSNCETPCSYYLASPEADVASHLAMVSGVKCDNTFEIRSAFRKLRNLCD